ncbi:MAG: hypothetical protein NWQ54_00975 [Paraglaciecola sp.]|uniref:hypothetical protein n=1 Tax=Paraglaciecola sp. TaxID=1920173 RepID=UPI00273DBF02|nr:hypothetical protein [Paraglaciecola sp.]MDP5029124.1 hypothetical protein [Paraglaciecola sp.]MDP5129423.1 hypothetical protein [Paraglaciecola sp.]
MKKLFVSIVVSAACLSFNANAALESAKKVKFVGDTEFAGFCKAAINNDVNTLKRAIERQVGVLASSKQRVLDIVLDEKNVSCAGKGLAEFSETRQATDVVNFIQAKISQ